MDDNEIACAKELLSIAAKKNSIGAFEKIEKDAVDKFRDYCIGKHENWMEFIKKHRSED